MGMNIRLANCVLFCFDLLIVHGGLLAAFWLHDSYSLDAYLHLLPGLSAAALVIFTMFDLYAKPQRRGLDLLIGSVVLAVGMLALCAALFTSLPGVVIVMAGLLQGVLLLVWRAGIWQVGRRVYGGRKVLVVADDPIAGLLIEERLDLNMQGWFTVAGVLTTEEQERLAQLLPGVDAVVLGGAIGVKKELVSLCARYGKEALVVPELFELVLFGAEPQQIGDLLVLSITPPKLKLRQQIVKRGLDLLAAGLLLIVLSPLLCCLYLLIPLHSPGPAVFRQERLGQGGKPFALYKFRSMVSDAELATGPVLALQDDPRVTRLGRFLRATRLDEAPQLINVLRGEMSLVGPRPERAYFIDQFKETVPDYLQRLSVRPGLTGLAQVRAGYSSAAADKLRFDLMYMQNYSFVLDLKILFQTLRVVLLRQQAEGVPEQQTASRSREHGMKEMV
ncbi:exopolysaccharide biosynthesis polyprenyl glycosylphosphotransferase [Tumebacillus sp. BK434]|uniref:sugar transferase n=1 Tax=Tumebacillus sp. BK434 TaxID=2512169 RepID=UPI001045B83F|nr:sugar transferase [Tumebacillus sp. BK434]TCP58978.1 exopolysaccharide biosynthesis polyprenyl glycosylphosphotransferase [Tumebacillus sp. BK434]